ncbi:hypothetical protein POTOM_021508 [Populus tomentosa]|uniref:RRM domain-containing protein n=1 Tax=Populus tomentosa TaxID=118781 RepID=A0A8X7ZMQ7_POPTO|nr:hypothetical protein POTOM_021508 [Populus tomentosa]
MSHFGRSGPPDIRDTFSLLVLNITFRIYTSLLSRTTADDLFPLFDKYGKVVDVFIPRDRRTGESRGFAFVRYKYAEEARKAVDRLDGYQSGRIVESSSKIKGRSRSRSPRPRYRDGYRDRDKDRDRDYRRRSRSRSRDRYDRDGYRGRDRDYHPRSVSHSPDHRKECGRGHDEKRHRRSQSYGSPNSPRSPSPHRAHPRDGSPNGRNDNKRSPNGSPNSPRSPSPHRAHPRDGSPNGRNDNKRSPTSKSVSPCNEPVDS